MLGEYNSPNNFRVNVKDPFSPLNREINHSMIKPQKKFDTIMEEYIAVRAQFDNVKKNISKGEAATGDNSKGEVLVL